MKIKIFPKILAFFSSKNQKYAKISKKQQFLDEKWGKIAIFVKK